MVQDGASDTPTIGLLNFALLGHADNKPEDAEAFERSMHELVLGTSHTGFFHQSVKRVPARLAIGAPFRKAGTNGDTRWIVQDVHEGGPAHDSGLKPGDVVRLIDGGGRRRTGHGGGRFWGCSVRR